jgi:hypothetical protein
LDSVWVIKNLCHPDNDWSFQGLSNVTCILIYFLPTLLLIYTSPSFQKCHVKFF